MSPVLDPAATTARLTLEEERELLATLQDVPTSATFHDDGTVTRTYTATAASEAAWTRLVTAFLPALHATARRGRNMDREDAFSVVLEEFTEAAREYDLDDPAPFRGWVNARMRRALSDASRTSNTVTVRESTSVYYWRLMHAHGHDVHEAYAACQLGGTGLAPMTFLAVHRALAEPESVELFAQADEDSPGRFRPYVLADPHPGPEENLVQRELVRWLLSTVTDRQERVVRARYGFDDPATVSAVEATGLRSGEVLSDVQVGAVFRIARSTAQREKDRALTTMRGAMQRLVDEEG